MIQGEEMATTSKDDARALVNRLRRIEGQARGIAKMLEEGRDCGDVVQQIAAMRNALDRLGYEVVRANLRACLAGTELGRDTEGQLEKALAALGGLRS